MRSRRAEGEARRAARPTASAPIRLISEADCAALLRAFRDLAPTGEATEPVLRAVLEDTVDHPGSFLRAQIAFDVSRRRGLERERATAVAIGIEYFHTASLLFDDLPMMDDARERRGRPCPHRVYGESAAVLGALALVNRAYGLLWGVLAELPAHRSRAAAEVVSVCLGAAGVLGGQSRDLNAHAGELRASEIRRVALEKTVPLIRLPLHLPALVAGAAAGTLETLDRLATSWGLAYQILDDCRDALLGSAETGKSTARDRLLGRPNLLHHAGAARTLEELRVEMRRSRECLERLHADPVGESDGSGEALERLQALLEAEVAKIRGLLPMLPSLGATAPARMEALAC